jgi:hypothetical protein
MLVAGNNAMLYWYVFVFVFVFIKCNASGNCLSLSLLLSLVCFFVLSLSSLTDGYINFDIDVTIFNLCL